MKDDTSCCYPAPHDHSLPVITDMIPDSWSWMHHPQVSTKEVLVQGDKATFHREYSYGTAAVRGSKRLTANTVAYWEVKVAHRLYGTSIMFGIGNEHAKCSMVHRFEDLLGSDSDSYGLSYSGQILHDGVSVRFCDPFPPSSTTTVGLLFHGPSASLAYFRDGTPLGVAFTNIDLSQTLYPMISSTAQKSEMVVCNRRVVATSPESLGECAMRRVSQLLNTHHELNSLRLPVSLSVQLDKRIAQRTNRHLCMRPAILSKME